MAEDPMSLRPRKVLHYACDEIGSDTYLRKEGNRGKKKRENNFFAVAHCYRGSKRLPRAIKSRMVMLLKNIPKKLPIDHKLK